MRLLPLGLLLSMSLAGCASPGFMPAGGPLATAAPELRVVVGIVDSGVNPYHGAYRDDGAVLPDHFRDARTGEAPVAVRLSREGSFEERLAKDREVWSSLQAGRLYWFESTRVLALSLDEHDPGPLIVNDSGHGNAVASTIRAISRDAWVVVVDTPVSLTDIPAYGAIGVMKIAADGVAWLAEQSWVDVVSLSIGLPVNPPLAWAQAGYPQAQLAAAEAGKVVLNGAGNYPPPSWHGTSGPPWVISVGGGEPSTHGGSVLASQGVDVISDYTRWAAGQEPDEYQNWTGTSFATPTVAGVLAEALLQLRTEAGHRGGIREGIMCVCQGRNISAGDLRGAMNVSAVYWEASQYDPLNYSELRTPTEVVFFAFEATLPVGPAPWVQMGWGYVGEEAIPGLVAALRGQPPPPKPEEARSYMAAVQTVREAYWR